MKTGDEVIDLETGKVEKVNVTSNSVEITRTKLTEKGINCTNWFAIDKSFMKKFNLRHYRYYHHNKQV